MGNGVVKRRKPNFWPPARDAQLRALIAQCGPNLDRMVIAHDLGLGRGNTAERMVRNRIRDLGLGSASPI